MDDDDRVSAQLRILGDGAAAVHARRLVPALDPVLGAGATCDLRESPPVATDWAASGGKSLTGFASGPPLDVRGHPASAARAALALITSLTGALLPGIELIGERATLLGLTRNAPFSCGGAMGILPCSVGHVALSLARPTDVELLPAAIEGPVGADPWEAVGAWLGGRPAADAAARLQLLGIPASPVGVLDYGADRPWLLASGGGVRRSRAGTVHTVVDLTSLWAGPLCARLLRATGLRVIKVESDQRPDGARRGSRAFFERMNAGSEELSLDLTTARGRSSLDEVIREADLVIEASRPRALAHLGISATDVVASGTTWLSITARGRSSDWVGFGDDVAAGAGLLARSEQPLPAGDALADPLAGVHAALAATAALTSDRAWLLDLSMHDVARLCTVPAGPDVDRQRASP
nr:CoA transferase [Dietzia maris]